VNFDLSEVCLVSLAGSLVALGQCMLKRRLANCQIQRKSASIFYFEKR